MVSKLPPDLARYLPPADDFSSYTLLDVTDEFVKLINNNIYFFPDDSIKIYSKLLNRYNELKAIIEHYAKI